MEQVLLGRGSAPLEPFTAYDVCRVWAAFSCRVNMVTCTYT